jgi:hypothetical protein
MDHSISMEILAVRGAGNLSGGNVHFAHILESKFSRCEVMMMIYVALHHTITLAV